MILQRKLLQIAHSDADNNLSMQAVSERNALRRWSAEKVNLDMLKKLDDGKRVRVCMKTGDVLDKV